MRPDAARPHNVATVQNTDDYAPNGRPASTQAYNQNVRAVPTSSCPASHSNWTTQTTEQHGSDHHIDTATAQQAAEKAQQSPTTDSDSTDLRTSDAFYVTRTRTFPQVRAPVENPGTCGKPRFCLWITTPGGGAEAEP